MIDRVPVLRLDATRARSSLRWAPVWGFERGVGATVEWYRAVADGDDPLGVTLDQLRRYERDMENAA